MQQEIGGESGYRGAQHCPSPVTRMHRCGFSYNSRLDPPPQHLYGLPAPPLHHHRAAAMFGVLCDGTALLFKGVPSGVKLQ